MKFSCHCQCLKSKIGRQHRIKKRKWLQKCWASQSQCELVLGSGTNCLHTLGDFLILNSNFEWRHGGVCKKLRARVCYSKLGRRQRVTQAIFQTTKLRFIFQGGEAIYATVQFLTSDTDTEILYFERLCVTTFSKYYHLRRIFLFL